ncbi:MAG: hypothetical protein DRH50_14555, partial [Deltaproteobacteria bacterium]
MDRRHGQESSFTTRDRLTVRLIGHVPPGPGSPANLWGGGRPRPAAASRPLPPLRPCGVPFDARRRAQLFPNPILVDIRDGSDIFEPMEIGRASGTMTGRERRSHERASATERNERRSKRALVSALLALIILSCAGGIGVRAQGPLPDPAVNMLFDDIQEYEKHLENRDNISFTPSRPRPGEKVEIKVRVFNAGKAKADEARVVLYDGNRKIGEKEIRNLRASKARTVEF